MRFSTGDSRRGKIRIADEHEVGREALAGQFERQFLHAHPEPAGHGVLVGSLEGEQDELERLGRQAEKIGHDASLGPVGSMPATTRSIPRIFLDHARFRAFVLLSLLSSPQKDGKAQKAWRSSICFRKTGSRRRGTTSRPISQRPRRRPSTRERLQPAGPDDLAPLFPMGLIMQEMSTERLIEIPDEVREIYKLWRPTPLIRAARWEKALGTPAKIYFKYEGVSPAGSHKPNTADRPGLVQQAGRHHQADHRDRRRPVGLRPGPRLPDVRHGVLGLHGEGLLLPEALSPEHDPGVGRGSHPQPLRHHRSPAGPSWRRIRIRRVAWASPSARRSKSAAQRDDTHYSLGSVLNHVLLHQTVIGQEALEQMELAGAYPDFVVACVGGGSNFAGIGFPFVGENIKKGKKTRIIAVEPAACPTHDQGRLRVRLRRHRQAHAHS